MEANRRLAIARRDANAAACFFTPGELYEALEGQREACGGKAAHQCTPNEMVVDTSSLSFPDAVMAVFFTATSSAAEVKAVRYVHDTFLKEYGMQETTPGAPPLLLLDLVGAGDRPFSVPGPAWLEDW